MLDRFFGILKLHFGRRTSECSQVNTFTSRYT